MKLRYLAFEGIDGAGKDTQLTLLARRLEREGVTPITLFEPSFGAHGRRIRANLDSIADNPEQQRAAFSADRADHVATKISPALKFVHEYPGFVILQNRSLVSAAAYQPRGDGDQGLLDTVAAELRVAPMPDLVIILDVPVEAAMRRIAREGVPDAMEHPRRLAAARNRYRRLGDLLPVCHVVDGNRERASVSAEVYELVRGHFG